MTDMPEKIWADTTCEWWLIDASWRPEDLDGLVSYIREDVAEARIAAARAEALEEAATLADARHHVWISSKSRNPADYASPYSIIAAAIRDLAEKGEG